MKQSCIEPQDIGTVLVLPMDHPRRLHMTNCFRCRALLLAYNEFMDPGNIAEEEDFQAADRELASRLATVLSPDPHRLSLVRPQPSRHRGLYVLAAVLVACAGIFLGRDMVLMRQQPVLDGVRVERGGADDRIAAHWAETPLGWELQWTTTPDVDQVVVSFFDASMNDLVALDGWPGLTLDRVPVGAVYLQVLHLAYGDTVARSPMSAARPGGS